MDKVRDFFCGKMEKARNLREEMGRKTCFIPARVGVFNSDVKIGKIIFALRTLTCRVNIYVSRQGKGINRRKEGTDLKRLLELVNTDDNNQSCYLQYEKTVKQRFVFPFSGDNQFLITNNLFSRGKGNS